MRLQWSEPSPSPLLGAALIAAKAAAAREEYRRTEVVRAYRDKAVEWAARAVEKKREIDELDRATADAGEPRTPAYFVRYIKNVSGYVDLAKLAAKEAAMYIVPPALAALAGCAVFVAEARAASGTAFDTAAAAAAAAAAGVAAGVANLVAIAKAEARTVPAVVEAVAEEARALDNRTAAGVACDAGPHLLREINSARQASLEAARCAYIHRNKATLHAMAVAEAAALVVYRGDIDPTRTTYGLALANVAIDALTAAAAAADAAVSAAEVAVAAEAARVAADAARVAAEVAAAAYRAHVAADAARAAVIEAERARLAEEAAYALRAAAVIAAAEAAEAARVAAEAAAALEEARVAAVAAAAVIEANTARLAAVAAAAVEADHVAAEAAAAVEAARVAAGIEAAAVEEARNAAVAAAAAVIEAEATRLAAARAAIDAAAAVDAARLADVAAAAVAKDTGDPALKETTIDAHSVTADNELKDSAPTKEHETYGNFEKTYKDAPARMIKATKTLVDGSRMSKKKINMYFNIGTSEPEKILPISMLIRTELDLMWAGILAFEEAINDSVRQYEMASFTMKRADNAGEIGNTTRAKYVSILTAMTDVIKEAQILEETVSANCNETASKTDAYVEGAIKNLGSSNAIDGVVSTVEEICTKATKNVEKYERFNQKYENAENGLTETWKPLSCSFEKIKAYMDIYTTKREKIVTVQEPLEAEFTVFATCIAAFESDVEEFRALYKTAKDELEIDTTTDSGFYNTMKLKSKRVLDTMLTSLNEADKIVANANEFLLLKVGSHASALKYVPDYTAEKAAIETDVKLAIEGTAKEDEKVATIIKAEELKDDTTLETDTHNRLHTTSKMEVDAKVATRIGIDAITAVEKAADETLIDAHSVTADNELKDFAPTKEHETYGNFEKTYKDAPARMIKATKTLVDGSRMSKKKINMYFNIGTSEPEKILPISMLIRTELDLMWAGILAFEEAINDSVRQYEMASFTMKRADNAGEIGNTTRAKYVSILTAMTDVIKEAQILEETVSANCNETASKTDAYVEGAIKNLGSSNAIDGVVSTVEEICTKATKNVEKYERFNQKYENAENGLTETWKPLSCSFEKIKAYMDIYTTKREKIVTVQEPLEAEFTVFATCIAAFESDVEEFRALYKTAKDELEIDTTTDSGFYNTMKLKSKRVLDTMLTSLNEADKIVANANEFLLLKVGSHASALKYVPDYTAEKAAIETDVKLAIEGTAKEDEKVATVIIHHSRHPSTD